MDPQSQRRAAPAGGQSPAETSRGASQHRIFMKQAARKSGNVFSLINGNISDNKKIFCHQASMFRQQEREVKISILEPKFINFPAKSNDVASEFTLLIQKNQMKQQQSSVRRYKDYAAKNNFYQLNNRYAPASTTHQNSRGNLLNQSVPDELDAAKHGKQQYGPPSLNTSQDIKVDPNKRTARYSRPVLSSAVVNSGNDSYGEYTPNLSSLHTTQAANSR